MLNITRLSVDNVAKTSTATVEVYETVMGVQRLRDTFYISIPGVYQIDDEALQSAIYDKFSEIGYELVPTVDPTTTNISSV